MDDENFDTQKIHFNCNYIKKFCGNNKSVSNKILFENCDKLENSIKFIDENVKKLNFCKIPANGYSIFIKVITSFTEKIVIQIRGKNRVKSNFTLLFDLMFTYRDWIFDTHQKLIDDSKNSLMTQESDFSTRPIYNAIHSDDNLLQLIYSTYNGFWLPKEIRKFLNFVCFLIAFFYSFPFSIAALWNDKVKGAACVKAFKTYSNIDYCFDIWHLNENYLVVKLYKFLFSFIKNLPVLSRTLHLPRQTRFRLDYKGNILDFNKMSKEDIDAYVNDKEEQDRQNAPGKRHRNKSTIRCRYSYLKNKTKILESLERIENKKMNRLKSITKIVDHYSANRTPHSKNKLEKNELNNNVKNEKNENFEIKINEDDLFLDKDQVNPDNVLVIFLHGGGYLTQGSRSYEIFITEICDNLAGIPILSIDYSLSVPFPVANQELLDVYLWVLSGSDDVEEKLGFIPKKIILSGDSAGGFFSLSLIIQLNELNKLISESAVDNFANDQYPLPDSIIAIYPAYSLVNYTAAKTLFTLESLVEFHLYLLIVSVYGTNKWSIGDFKEIEKTELFQQIVSKNKDQFLDKDDEFNSPIEDSSPWFFCDYKNFKNYADFINHFYNNPFISPRLYAHRFEELKNTSLFAIVGDHDFLLDDSLELTRQWKGKVHLDVLKNNIHGFLQSDFSSENYKKVVNLLIERYQEACGLI